MCSFIRCEKSISIHTFSVTKVQIFIDTLIIFDQIFYKNNTFNTYLALKAGNTGNLDAVNRPIWCRLMANI